MNKLFILLLVGFLFVSNVNAVSIDNYDTFGVGVSGLSGLGANDVGYTDDGIVWVGGSVSFYPNNVDSFTDMVCADIDEDFIYDVCLFDTSSESDCKTAYSSYFDSGTEFKECDSYLGGLCGWGVYPPSPSISLDYDPFVADISSWSNYIDTDFVNDDVLIRFREFQDCDDSLGELDTNYLGRYRLRVTNNKGVVCSGNDSWSKEYQFVDSELFGFGVDCEFIDPLSGVNFGFCNSSAEYNSSVINDVLDDICYVDFSLMSNFYDSQDSLGPCDDNKISAFTNETEPDYGGICGNCSVNGKDSDVSYVVAKALQIIDYGNLGFNNPFNSTYCESSDPVVSIPIFFIIVLFIIVIILLIVIGGVISVLLSSLFSISFFRLSKFIIKKSKKYINTKNK